MFIQGYTYLCVGCHFVSRSLCLCYSHASCMLRSWMVCP